MNSVEKILQNKRSSNVLLDNIVHMLEQDKVKFRAKSEWWVWRLISKINPDFNKDIVTTLGSTIWFPDSDNNEWLQQTSSLSLVEVLCHEFVHVCDSREHKLKYYLSYATPQIFSILGLASIAGFWNAWLFLFSLFFLCLLKLPSPRLHWEARGYAMSVGVHYWQTGILPAFSTGTGHFLFEEFVDNLASSTYYIGKSKEKIRNIFNTYIENLLMKDKDPSSRAPFARIRKIIRLTKISEL